MGASQSDEASKEELGTRIKSMLASADPAKVKKIGGVFLFDIIKETSVYSWTLDLNQVIAYEGEPEEDPDATITLTEYYFKQLIYGREDAKAVLWAKKCCVNGNVMRVMKLADEHKKYFSNLK